MKNKLLLALFFGASTIYGCKDDAPALSKKEKSVPDVYKKIYGAKKIYLENDFVVIEANGIPDHKSPYFLGTEWESSKYEANTNSSFSPNSHAIGVANTVYKIPLHPKQATDHQATSGHIGVAVNGIPFFNQYQGQTTLLRPSEKATFDQYNGHPTALNWYHYHLEPVFITANKGANALVGFLIDGFPVYGPVENGSVISNSDLDSFHGHFGVTADYPDGIYHYHITTAAPYINGDGYYGTPGTVSF